MDDLDAFLTWLRAARYLDASQSDDQVVHQYVKSRRSTKVKPMARASMSAPREGAPGGPDGSSPVETAPPPPATKP